jgi:S1-C subfamily serine protease
MKKRKIYPWLCVAIAGIALAVSLMIIIPAVSEKETEPLLMQASLQQKQGQLVARYLRESFRAAVGTIKPAVVSISTLHLPKEDAARSYQEIGSGFFVNADGFILTNYHVIAEADEIKVTRFDGDHNHFYDAYIVGQFPEVDLAILKVNSNERFPCAIFANSDKVKVGDWVLAIGSPFGLDQSVTAGIVSATRQSLFIDGVEYKDLIQTDAPINPGNSGGPLVNVRGEVIGINTAISASPQITADIGFAIPSNKAKALLKDIGISYIKG